MGGRREDRDDTRSEWRAAETGPGTGKPSQASQSVHVMIVPGFTGDD